jgi:hypothetical protein
LVGPEGIEASKWRSTEWLRKKHLPPHYGILSSNISESSNSLYEDACKLPWLYCIDNILTTMSTRISTLRDVSCDKVGVVPEVVGILQNRWNDSEKHQIIQLEEGGDTYRVTHIYKPRSYTRSKYDIIQKNSMTSYNFFRQNV